MTHTSLSGVYPNTQIPQTYTEFLKPRICQVCGICHFIVVVNTPDQLMQVFRQYLQAFRL